MKIATYNLWNSDEGMPRRMDHIETEIRALGADVLCLQETKNGRTAERLAKNTGYGHLFFEAFEREEEGLCILSRFPMARKTCWLNDANSIYAEILQEERRIGVINCHLSWESALQRERQAAAILSRVRPMHPDLLFLVGDFNCSHRSDVQRYLLGECTLQGTEASPCFFDLAEAYGKMCGEKPQDTLDFRENPRFRGSTVEPNQRFDRILLQNPHPKAFPILKSCFVWGKTVWPDTGLAASDHYGVCAEMEWE